MKLLALLVVAAALNGCVCLLSPKEKAGEKWLTEHPGVLYGESVEFHEITGEKIVEAISDLSSVPIVQISQERATWYTGNDFAEQTNGKYYLVRAVYGYKGTGGYDVTYDGKSLFIQHVSLGSCLLYNRSALVVKLSSEPRNVYIDVNVAK